MTDSPRIDDTSLITFGLLTATARAVLPPVADLPLVRAIRGAMFEGIARAAQVTLTVQARQILEDLDEASSGRGALETAARWAAGRFVPGGAVLDGVRSVMLTYGAGAMFQRYLVAHRPNGSDPVMSIAEAQNVRRAIRASIEVVHIEQLRAMTRLVMDTAREIARTRDGGLVDRYGDATVSALAGLPLAWIKVMDEQFAKALVGMR